MSAEITVYKLNHRGEEQLHYSGRVLDRGPAMICIEAYFRMDVRRAYVHFRPGDRLVEWFYSDRWYNIFELHDVDDDHLKGWYCNITRPAILLADRITADDLALDLFITPTGEVTLLDEDEFAALHLPPADAAAALAAVAALRAQVAGRVPPFDLIQ